jgi:hypothetical protein
MGLPLAECDPARKHAQGDYCDDSDCDLRSIHFFPGNTSIVAPLACPNAA